MLISCGGELSFDRAGKPRSLQAGDLTSEGSLGGMKNEETTPTEEPSTTEDCVGVPRVPEHWYCNSCQ